MNPSESPFRAERVHLQEFTLELIPVTPEMEQEPRYGVPDRSMYLAEEDGGEAESPTS